MTDQDYGQKSINQDHLARNDLAHSIHRDTLLNRVDLIADALRNGADSCEDHRILIPESLRALRESGLLAALVPEEVGGYQVDPVTELELIEAISAIDGSTGWSFWALAGSTARVASMLPAAAEGEVFKAGEPFPLFAFQERPFGNYVQPSEEGLIVSGRWPFGTGVAAAEWVVAIGELANDARGKSPFDSSLLAAAVPTSQITIIDNWDAAGLSGTGTFDYLIKDVLVPWSRVWPYPPAKPIRGDKHFCLRRAPIKHTGFALGVARNSLNSFIQHTIKRATTRGNPEDTILSAVVRAKFKLDAARSLAISTVTDIWYEAREKGAVNEKSQNHLRAMARYVTEVALDTCSLAMHYGDASMIGRQHQLQRSLRDITVGAAHAEVSHSALAQFGNQIF